MSETSHYRERVKFTRKMKKDYTILTPSMAPIHFKILRPILQREGYSIDIMENDGPEVLQMALKYVTTQKDMYMVHLVSFGCGLDALTTDEVRSILEHAGQLYTQIKIDEVTNLGAIKIRLRSLIAAIEQQSKEAGNG